MPKAIQFHFDDNTEIFVRNIWQRIHENGISSRMIERPFTPHVTLIVAEDFDADQMKENIRSFLKNQSPLHSLFASLSTFHNENSVLFLGVVVTDELLNTHQNLFARVKDTLKNPNAYYFPGRWVPHCTLLKESTPEKISETLKILDDFKLPIKIEITRIAIVQYPECATLDEVSL